MSNRADAAQREIEIARLYRALFLNDDGTPKPEADAILRDLERECGWMSTNLPTITDGSIDPLRLAADTAKRKIFAHLKKRLFAPLEPLKRVLENEE